MAIFRTTSGQSPYRTQINSANLEFFNFHSIENPRNTLISQYVCHLKGFNWKYMQRIGTQILLKTYSTWLTLCIDHWQPFLLELGYYSDKLEMILLRQSEQNLPGRDSAWGTHLVLRYIEPVCGRYLKYTKQCIWGICCCSLIVRCRIFATLQELQEYQARVGFNNLGKVTFHFDVWENLPFFYKYCLDEKIYSLKYCKKCNADKTLFCSISEHWRTYNGVEATMPYLGDNYL